MIKKWQNDCDKTAPAALRYLAENDRPSGGESLYNAAHLYQIAAELEATALEAALSVPVPAQEADSNGETIIAWYGTLGPEWRRKDNSSPAHMTTPREYAPTPAHSGEREALERAASQLVNSELAQQVRKLVAGWNGDGVAEEYRMGRHDDALGVTLPTNCGSIYMLDEVIHELRAALEGKQP